MYEIKEFKYNEKDRRVLILKEEADGFSGIDLNITDPALAESIEGLLADLEEQIGLALKQGYRKFLSKSVVEKLNENNPIL